MKLEAYPVYRVIAKNTDPDSENPIHSDETAARHGFRAGLAPGVSIYGYMTVPLVRQLGRDWLERGWMRIRFRKPFCDGDDLFARAVSVEGDAFQLTAMGDGEVRVSADAGIESPPLEDWDAAQFLRLPLPDPRTSVRTGPLGTLVEKPADEHARLVEALGDPLPFYRGEDAVVHPTVLLGLSNLILMRNFDLPPWLHVGSELRNRSTAAVGEALEARGVVREVFEKKGNRFLTVDVLVLASDGRVVQQVRHTAIWSLAGGG
jgi:acyl dehydratase